MGKYDAVAYSACRSKDPAKWVFTIAANSGGKTTQGVLKDVMKVLATEKDKPNIAVSLYATQLYMGLGNTTGAIETMECLLNELEQKEGNGKQGSYPPSLVGVLVALYRQQGRKNPPSHLYKAASYWSSQPNPNSSLMLSAAFQLLTTSQPPTAPVLAAPGTLLSSIPPLSTQIPSAILSAGLVAAYATTSPELAKPHLASLPALDTLLKGVDVDALEAAGLYTQSRKRPLVEEDGEFNPRGENKKVKSQQQQAKKRRVRKNKLPKNYVEGKEMDKERWLALRERSYYKPDKKKGAKRNMAQGSGGIGATRAENENPVTEFVQTKMGITSVGGGSGSGGGQVKKKKKKGAKW